MNEKLNLDEIKKIPQDEFKEILHSWMEKKEIAQTYQRKLRKELVLDFQKTELGKQLNSEKQKVIFNSKDYVIDTLQAEHLYLQDNHLTLSVFFTETRHPTILPNFEKENQFRFEKDEVLELVGILGISKSDKIARRIQNVYKASKASLLSVVLMELVNVHKSTETRSVAMQSEPEKPLDFTVMKAKSKIQKRGKNHGLVTSDFRARKPKRIKEVTVITQNLEKMSDNINLITNKLDDFKRNPSSDESKSIICHVSSIMGQLNKCIGNFESICQDIKQINEARTRSYDEWMDDLKNSENGRRFLKKLQKSFSKVVNEEKSEVQRDYRKKLEREKSKLEKFYRRKPAKQSEGKIGDFSIVKEIGEIFENTCRKMHNIENEDELFRKSLELDFLQKPLKQIQAPTGKGKTKSIETTSIPVDLNKCRKLHSQSSNETYNSQGFESEKSDENN